MSQRAPILIIGGAGKTGGRVNALLKAQGLDTRPVSRSTTPAFDWTEPNTWASALEGVSRAYVTFQPDIAVPGASQAIAALSSIAREKGLKHMVLLSGRGEPGAQNAEEALKASGIAWTIVRASWFNQNFSEGFLIEGVRAGAIALPAEPVREPFVDANDIADVVVAALTEARHTNRLYEVTGPRAITFAEATQEIAKALGRTVTYVQITPEAFSSGMRAQGVPGDVVDLVLDLFTTVLDGRNTNLTHGVEEALGRPPRDFADFARAAAASGVWGV